MNELLMHALPKKESAPVSKLSARSLLNSFEGKDVYVFGADCISLVEEYPEKEFTFLIESREDFLEILTQKELSFHVRMPGSSERDFFHNVALRKSVQRPLVIGTDREREETLKRAIITSFFINQEKDQYPELLPNILGAYPAIQRASLFDTLDKPMKGIPAIVVGAGPSLSNSLQAIKELQGQAVIIAGGSAISILDRESIHIDLAVACDPNEAEFERLKTVRQKRIPLLFSARLNHKVHTLGFDPVYVALQTGGIVEERIVESLGITYQDTVDRESSTVMSIALDAAHRLGCASISLVGVDLCYQNGDRYPKGTHFSCGNESFMDSVEVEGRMTTSLWARERVALERQIEEYENVYQVQGGLSVQTALRKEKLELVGRRFGDRLTTSLEQSKHKHQARLQAVLTGYEESLERCQTLYTEKKEKPHLIDVIEHDLSEEIAFEDLLSLHQNQEEYLRRYLEVFKKMKSW